MRAFSKVISAISVPDCSIFCQLIPGLCLSTTKALNFCATSLSKVTLSVMANTIKTSAEWPLTTKHFFPFNIWKICLVKIKCQQQLYNSHILWYPWTNLRQWSFCSNQATHFHLKQTRLKIRPLWQHGGISFLNCHQQKGLKFVHLRNLKNCYIILFLNKQQKNYLTFHYVIYCPLIYVLKVYLKKLLVPRDNTPSHLETVMLANQLLYNQLGFALKIRFI